VQQHAFKFLEFMPKMYIRNGLDVMPWQIAALTINWSISQHSFVY